MNQVHEMGEAHRGDSQESGQEMAEYSRCDPPIPNPGGNMTSTLRSSTFF